jgi:hypothetical protein
MFDEEEVDEDEEEWLKAKESSKNKQNLHLKSLGWLDSTEVSMKNKRLLTVKFSDDENTYNLYKK